MGAQNGRPDGVPEEIAGLHEERRTRRSNLVGVASLACPVCDAPAPLVVSPVTPASELACPYCDHAGAVRDFLTFREPVLAPRVNVFVRIAP